MTCIKSDGQTNKFTEKFLVRHMTVLQTQERRSKDCCLNCDEEMQGKTSLYETIHNHIV